MPLIYSLRAQLTGKIKNGFPGSAPWRKKHTIILRASSKTCQSMKGGSQVIRRESLINIHHSAAGNGRRDGCRKAEKTDIWLYANQ